LIVAYNDYEGTAQMGDCVLDTLQRQTIIGIAGDAHDKEIADALVKDNLRRHP
jgi:hypothetical protein